MSSRIEDWAMLKMSKFCLKTSMLKETREGCEVKNLANRINRRGSEWWNIKVIDLVEENFLLFVLYLQNK